MFKHVLEWRDEMARRVVNAVGHNFSFSKLKELVYQSEQERDAIWLLAWLLADEKRLEAARWRKLARQFDEEFRPKLLQYLGVRELCAGQAKLELTHPSFFCSR